MIRARFMLVSCIAICGCANHGGGAAFDAEAYTAPQIASISVAAAGAIPNDGLDDSAAFHNAMLALPNGGRLDIGPGTFDLLMPCVIPRGDILFQGEGSATTLRKGALANSAFTAIAANGLTFLDLTFAVAQDTPASQMSQSLIELNYCNGLRVERCEFNSLTAGGPTLFSQLLNVSGNDASVSDSRFIGAFGNSTGAMGEASGNYGLRHLYSGNQFTDFCDTGLGLWTNCADTLVVNNYFRGYEGLPGMVKVCIDGAGSRHCRISGNTMIGATIGVRVLTNLIYTNTDLAIELNDIREQAPSAYEPAQCIKVSHGDAQNMNVDVLNNHLSLGSGSSYGMALYSYNSVSQLRVACDGNVFTAANGACLTAQGYAGAGNLKYNAGRNIFRLSGTATQFAYWGVGGITITNEVLLP